MLQLCGHVEAKRQKKNKLHFIKIIMFTWSYVSELFVPIFQPASLLNLLNNVCTAPWKMSEQTQSETEQGPERLCRINKQER